MFNDSPSSPNLPHSPMYIMDIEFLRALQPGTPTPNSRSRIKPASAVQRHLPPVEVEPRNLQVDTNQSRCQQVWSQEPKTPMSSNFSINPSTPIVQTTFSYTSDDGYYVGGSDRASSYVTPSYNHDIYDGPYRRYGPNDEQRFPAYDCGESPMDRKLPVAPEGNITPLLPLHIRIRSGDGTEVLIPPSHPDWRNIWAALHGKSQSSAALPGATYIWRDGVGVENVRHVQGSDAGSWSIQRLPQECPLPPHLADLPIGHAVMIHDSGDEEVLSPDHPITQYLLEASEEDGWDGPLPCGCTLRWRDDQGRTFAFRTLPQRSQSTRHNSLSSLEADTCSESDGSQLEYVESADVTQASSVLVSPGETNDCNSESLPIHPVQPVVRFSDSCRPSSSVLVRLKSPAVSISYATRLVKMLAPAAVVMSFFAGRKSKYF